MGQQVALSVAEDHIGDDLLVGGVVLDLAAGHEEGALPEHPLNAFQPLVDEAVPGPVGKEVLPPHAEHVLEEWAGHYWSPPPAARGAVTGELADAPPPTSPHQAEGGRRGGITAGSRRTGA